MSDLFYHVRRLGDRRPEPSGLPVCPCGRTFQPTRPGQTECLKHAGPARDYADSALAVPAPLPEPPLTEAQNRRLLAAIFPERVRICVPIGIAIAAMQDVGCQQAATREDWGAVLWSQADIRRGQFRLPESWMAVGR